MKVNKILFITLSNIGDVILTLPVLDYLQEEFPQAKITVMTGERAKEIFEDNPAIDRLIIYEKQAPLREKIKLFQKLKKENFDSVVDLRNTLFGLLLPARYKIASLRKPPKDIQHAKDRHLYKIKEQKSLPDRPAGKIKNESPPVSLFIKPQDKEYIDSLVKDSGIKKEDKIAVISAGARSHTKRWMKEKFANLITSLIKEFGFKIILVGDRNDIAVNKYITENLGGLVLDLSGRTTLRQLASLLKKADLVITNDSAVLHIASYLNRPIVAIFGPTDENKYGPWSDKCVVVKKEIYCRPCQKAECKFGTLDCLEIIKVEDVLRAARNLLTTSYEPRVKSCVDFKRILIVRTDRIGDVLLSTPVIEALRNKYPHAYIAMMVSPYTKEIVEGNPYLDRVIVYDKDGKHKSWLRSMKFAQRLKKKRFDLAIILHPTNRVHLVTFFAGIPKRIGYNRKLGFLLTDKIPHTKQLGQKHELEYNLDLLRYLGIEAQSKNLFIPIKSESEKWADQVLEAQGLNKKERILCIHPGASCPSKIWPNVRFAEVADKLIKKYGFKALIVSGPKDILLAENLIRHMKNNAINLAGRTSVNQLASILKRCNLFISNDSGPVHIASAVGTPVISIFGRNQLGLSPRRWGPVGRKDKVLHKPAGCIECLAHNCHREFACLKAITVEDVLNAADEVLSYEK